MRSIAQVGLVGIAVAVLCTATRAQTTPPPSTRTRPDPIQKELQRRFESEAIERALSGNARGGPEHDRRLVIAQIKEDFLRIQIVNDDLRASRSNAGAIDLKVVARAASEISKLAKRLRENLALPQLEKDDAQSLEFIQDGPDGLSFPIAVLSNLINAFVENPVFERYQVVDTKLAMQARRHLEQIISVSKQIKKTSERMKRAA